MNDSIPAEILSHTKFLDTVRQGNWIYCHRPNARAVVCILAFTPKGLLLVEQYRIPVHRRLLELPAGLVGDDVSGESIEEAARRELIEETGWSADHFETLWKGPSSAGLSDEIITCLRADGLHHVSAGGGVEGESIIVHEVPLNSLRNWLASRAEEGIDADPKIFAALWAARLSDGASF